MQKEALLHHFHHRVLFKLGGWQNGHCLVQFRIKWLALGIDDFKVMVLHDLFEHLERQLLAFDQ